jgi:molybdopterin-binding protein
MKPPGPEVNRFKGVISEIKALPESIQIVIKAGNNQLVAEMPYHVFESMVLKVGQEVFLILKLRRIKVYEEQASL